MTPREELATAECVRHVKRGSLYVVRSMTACLQSSGGPVSEGAELVVYQSIEDGRWWARPRAEFEDGRFIAAGYRKVEAGRDARETARQVIRGLKVRAYGDADATNELAGDFGSWAFLEAEIATAITAAVEAQRERDARIVDEYKRDDPEYAICAGYRLHLAAAIREG